MSNTPCPKCGSFKIKAMALVADPVIPVCLCESCGEEWHLKSVTMIEHGIGSAGSDSKPPKVTVSENHCPNCNSTDTYLIVNTIVKDAYPPIYRMGCKACGKEYDQKRRVKPNFYFPVTLIDEDSCKGCDFLMEGEHNFLCKEISILLKKSGKRPENCPLIPIGFIKVQTMSKISPLSEEEKLVLKNEMDDI